MYEMVCMGYIVVLPIHQSGTSHTSK